MGMREMKAEKRISPTAPGQGPASEAHEVHVSVEARKRETLDKPLLTRPLSDASGSRQGTHRTAGPSRALRWSLAAVLGLAMLNLPLPAAALFAPAPIHKALFHLDEGSGTSTADALSGTTACLGSTLASPCPVAGASSPTWTSAARYGSALLFDGVDDTVTFEHSADLDWAAANNHIVIEAWIKPARAGTILSKGGSASHNYRLAIDPAGNLIFSYTDTKGKLRQLASPLDGNQAAPVSFGQWHWVSVSFSEDWNKVEMRVDGGMNDQKTSALRGGGFTAPDPRTNAASLSVGSFGGAADFFGGVIDELRISITPDASVYLGGYPFVGSDRGLVLSRVEFAPASGPDFFELHRPDLGDGAPPISLYGARIYDVDNNDYEVPFSGGGCVTGDRTCYLVSPGETVRIWLNGAGPALDTASATFSEWYTSNSSCCGTLGDGGSGQDLGPVDLLKLRTTGAPQEPGGPRYLNNADVVVWGADQSANPFFVPMVTPEGLWPGTVERAAWGFRVTSAPFVETPPGTTGIALIASGNNLAGPAAWG